MWRVYMSRAVNYYLFMGSPDQMFSSRVHIESWPRTEYIIDCVFFWQDRHCELCWRWERRYGEERQDAHQTAQEQALQAQAAEDALAHIPSPDVQYLKGGGP